MADTAIEWADAVWNPTTGCDRISSGCDNCYALTMAKRLKAMGQEKYQHDGDPRTSGPGFGLTVHEDALTIPLRWRKPRHVFVNSMSDLFHKDVPDEFIARVWQVMATTPQHTYQILTKRPARMRAWLRRCAAWDGYVTHNGEPPGGYNDGPDKGIIVGYLPSTVAKHYGSRSKGGPRSEVRQVGSWPLANVWLGVSVENQKWADIRVPALLDTPAAVRWLSCEPLLGPVDLGIDDPHRGHEWDDLGGYQYICLTCSAEDNEVPYFRREPGGGGLDWVVVGGESGPGARPMDLQWARSLVEQCRSAHVPVFVKQLGASWGASGDRKGGNPESWPIDLQVREYPTQTVTVAGGLL